MMGSAEGDERWEGEFWRSRRVYAVKRETLKTGESGRN
jgi:hypothetical protein